MRRAQKTVENARILSNAEIAPDVFEITFDAPKIAPTIQPGQFEDIHIGSESKHILRRPFSVYAREADTFTVMYQVLGDVTQILTQKKSGEQLSVLGPLGTGWTVPPEAKTVLFVTGGLGAAALGMLAKELHAQNVDTHVVMGAPTALRLVGRKHYESHGCGVHVATDDGSEGVKGFCTEVAADLIARNNYEYIATCGPEPMQAIVARLASEADVPCEVSLERYMACGIGACLSCVVTTTDGQKRACYDGPIFDAKKVIWNER